MSAARKKLRIAVLGTRGIPGVMGGVETHCQALYPRLAARGHKVTLFARQTYVQRNTEYFFNGVRIIPLWNPKRKSFEAIAHTLLGILKIARHVRDYDILHIHAIGPALLIPFARLTGLHIVMTHHGPDYDRQKWGFFAKLMLKLGERLGCRYSHTVITVSKHIRELVKKTYGTNGIYIPNGVELALAVPSGENLERFGIKPAKYFLAVGRFVPEKGFHDLIEAFIRLETDWQLVIAGAADHEDNYSSGLKQSASRDQRIILTGFVKGAVLVELLSNAGLFVLPSYHEGLPIALLEAMSHGLPVLTSDIPANAELAKDHEMYPAGNVDALRERMREYLSSPWKGDEGRKFVAENYDWNHLAEETERIYYSTASKAAS